MRSNYSTDIRVVVKQILVRHNICKGGDACGNRWRDGGAGSFMDVDDKLLPVSVLQCLENPPKDKKAADSTARKGETE
ncbi:hypothetical protein GOBAR_DD09441 [Gossypium barbadense]|nr:hypothetical protein GOBAR_DD09441 [Gossypium barbadense]